MNYQKENFEEKTGIICPICGCRSVRHLIHPTYPPQDHYECPNCESHKDIQRENPPERVAPFNNLTNK